MNESTVVREEYCYPPEAADIVCVLCGNPGTILFKNAFVCEDCLDYVKESLLK
ncbi:MAG: hypothetical protein PHQ50_02430 [Eubacteriales bacterium]|nr:hypothetical protein [Eubacteriales bacterium]MDD3349894.1 hypothetical protein [Eubacteriales bacterium]